MPLCWEINDVFRVDHSTGVERKHAAWFDFFVPASARVSLEIISKCLFELEGNPFAHDTHTIHCVYKGFRISYEYVSLF